MHRANVLSRAAAALGLVGFGVVVGLVAARLTLRPEPVTRGVTSTQLSQAEGRLTARLGAMERKMMERGSEPCSQLMPASVLRPIESSKVAANELENQVPSDDAETPEGIAAFDEAQKMTANALASGHWGVTERTAFRRKLSLVSANRRMELLEGLSMALNTGKIKTSAIPPM